MIQHSVEILSSSKIYVTTLNNQSFIDVSVTKSDINPAHTISQIYDKIADFLSATGSYIINERCFANIDFKEQFLESRKNALSRHSIDTNTPITFIEGRSCLGGKFAGIQMRTIRSADQSSVRTILDQGIPKGRTWNQGGSTFIMLQSIDGGKENPHRSNREFHTEAMFRQAERLLRSESASYQDVVRTWIYISEILDWYDKFNTVRNSCYSEYGFLKNPDSTKQAEQMYLPASTGIEGRNSFNYPATMDVLAVHRSSESTIQIRPIYGVKQRSPFRYGSAFSRAMVIDASDSKLILVSGTASIDEEGKTIFIGDVAAQIKHSLDVISALVAQEGAAFDDLCEVTVFIKRKEDFLTFQKIIEEMRISNMPSINVLADVCREELLFEIDAAFLVEKK